MKICTSRFLPDTRRCRLHSTV